MDASAPEFRALLAALAESQRLGMLGDRQIEEVVEHSGAFVEALGGVSGRVVDLGSGGGVPGLVIAVARPDLELVLVDRRAKRTDHLARLIARLGLRGRVSVRESDTDDLRRRREQFDAATARGFGPPELTLRTALDLVRPGGRVVISEPPRGDRWSELDIVAMGAVRAGGPVGVAVFERRST